LKWRPAFFNWSTSPPQWTAPRLDLDIGFDITGSEIRVTYGNGDVWVYGFNGLLSEVRHKSGYTQTLSYTGTNNTSITDSFGRTLAFTYDSRNLLTSLTAPDGKVYKYTYIDLVPLNLPSGQASGEYGLSTIIYPDNTSADDTDNPR
jgi:YD repeat-containing protein